MSGVNKVILVGRLGKDPEIKVLEMGRKVASFTLATSETYKDKNGDKQEVVEWHNVVYWGPIVDVIEKYIKKGHQLYIEGKLKTRSYEKNGEKRYVTEVLGQSLSMLGGGSKQETAEAVNAVVVEGEVDDDLPF